MNFRIYNLELNKKMNTGDDIQCAILKSKKAPNKLTVEDHGELDISSIHLNPDKVEELELMEGDVVF